MIPGRDRAEDERVASQRPNHDAVEGGERSILRTRPGIAFIALHNPALLAPPATVLAAWVLLRGVVDHAWSDRLLWIALAWLAAHLLWGVLARASRRYELTDRRLTVRAGVLRRVAGDVPLRNVQHVTMTRSLAERVLGLGTIGVATAGADGAAVRWLMVPHSARVMDTVTNEVRRAQGLHGSAFSPQSPAPESAGPPPSSGSPPSPRLRPVVIGLAGGIGAGKTEVARVLARLGCVVTDSDAEARAALDRPEVRAELVRWWGPDVLDAGGRVDRAAVARIVFNSPEARARLEGLVHPLVGAARRAVIAEAARAGAPAVVIDAPLLYEAGVDAECDAVIFVDAPRAMRLERVRSARGWDEEEFARREAAQGTVDAKRERADEIVVNDGVRESLEARVSAALARVMSRRR